VKRRRTTRTTKGKNPKGKGRKPSRFSSLSPSLRTCSNIFDKKFGDAFLKSVPEAPGVYVFKDSFEVVIYVGKAVNLRRRLGQYRKANRLKKQNKMRKILRSAYSVKLHQCSSDAKALLLENKLIQSLKPKLNVAGAYSFLYPAIGIKMGFEPGRISLCYTTSPQPFIIAGFKLHGTFRSREIAGNAYYSLLHLLGVVGHRESRKKRSNFPRVKFSHVAEFRQVDTELLSHIEDFFRGFSKDLLEKLSSALLEKPSARKKAAQVQEDFDHLMAFYDAEAIRLSEAIECLGVKSDFVPQKDRDRLFILSQAVLKRSQSKRKSKPRAKTDSRLRLRSRL
jgi:excinuclease UvrABC nuclease subunit